jgi:AraC-like DNA-binding protein
MSRKVISFQIPKSNKEFVRFQKDEGKHFYDKLHQHPQWQLTHIVEGKGQLMVGDYLGRFEAGDLIWITSNIPHVLRSDPEYFDPKENLHSLAHTLFFDFEALGKLVWETEELQELNQWLNTTKGSFKIDGENKEKLKGILKEFEHQKGTSKLLLSLQIIEFLQNSENLQNLNKNFPQKILSENEGKRLGILMSYILSNSQQILTLKEVANQANMSKEAFCRFFKERTGKTFTEFLVEVRIQNACQQLQEKDQSISQIAFQSGFQNLSYFNRAFKKIKGVSPRDFRVNFNNG